LLLDRGLERGLFSVLLGEPRGLDLLDRRYAVAVRRLPIFAVAPPAASPGLFHQHMRGLEPLNVADQGASVGGIAGELGAADANPAIKRAIAKDQPIKKCLGAGRYDAEIDQLIDVAHNLAHCCSCHSPPPWWMGAAARSQKPPGRIFPGNGVLLFDAAVAIIGIKVCGS
jgi:hypothetical protein